MKNYDFGEKLIQARQAKGWTQMNLAEKSNISLRTIQRIESGQANPRAYTVKQLSGIIGLDFFEIQKNSGDNGSKTSHSGFKLSKTILWHISDLFNLKTNTMKKVTVLTIIVSAICIGLFSLTFESKAQDPDNIDYTKFMKLGERGVTYFLPKGEKVFISNVKDTADCIIMGDKIQQYNNKMFLNAKYVGKVLKSDTVVYLDGKILIKSSYWKFTSSYGQKIHYLIPNGVRINNLSVQIDTENIFVPGHHIREFDYQIYLDGVFQFKTQANDTVIYRDGKIELLE